MLITGGTGGLGSYIASSLLKAGHKVTVTGRNIKILETMKQQGIQTIYWDMASGEDIPAAITFDQFDVIILNAGIGYFKNHHELSKLEIDNMILVNMTIPIQLATIHSRHFQQRGEGHLVFIGSLAGKMATPKASVYAATKHALDGYVQGLRMELQDSSVQISIIHPGPIDTPFIDKADTTGNYKKALGSHLLSIEEVAEKVLDVLEKPKGEVLIPGYLGVLAKLTKVFPLTVEKWGRRFYAKK
ncbi:SDR family NAD(P)-dependent oxidoreductase [Chryseomicrobium palamuruense]|uniref:SDR family NAD(P)-dependent oxidoreductase n=1 Tax=Chryseomicrobium palamuruense TaxID=682973 RepID=A0ABV8UZZ1_9BACL